MSQGDETREWNRRGVLDSELVQEPQNALVEERRVQPCLEDDAPELAAHRFAGPALEQDVVGHHDGCRTAYREHVGDVLDEIQLLVRGRNPEILPVIGQGFLYLFVQISLNQNYHWLQ